ncbi:DUF4381 domain-containing protein [Kangiella sediminilitoris]|uniref:DUF4381 domain-containing protein n=1 Tax=Kangiella sediminilitoris TaxID=1144748 RepID=A0A1B3B935_9GAMM|nr:DUF4381 domain-containing protein [Kangiella sediminilitoris]AOE49317.1 hypothetical protein KS2013_593 [Kangiella sediminilitoris]
MTTATNTPTPQQKQLLEQLRDIHSPTNIDWWPLAPGWWVIIALFILVAALLIAKYFVKKHHYRFSHYAIAELSDLKNSHESRWLAQTQHIMRRLSLCYLPRQSVTQLSQNEWVDLLKATNNNSLSSKSLQAFGDLPFKPAEETEVLDRHQLISEVIDWAAQLPEQSKSWPRESEESQHV